MDRRRAVLTHEPRMGRGDVADMRREAVLGEEGVEAPHRPVANDLGHDRCCRDRRAPLVAVDDSDVLRGARPEPEAVDEARLRRRSKRVESSTQAGEVRPVQTLPVDLGVGDHLHRDLRRAAEHRTEELLPVFGAHLLRVVQLRERANAMVTERVVVEQNTCDDERPGE
jgi:hypothetical protein